MALLSLLNQQNVFYRIENIVGKGENAAYHKVLLFPQCFQKAAFLGCQNLELFYYEVKLRGSLVRFTTWLLTLITTTVAFAASEDQDQAPQNV